MKKYLREIQLSSAILCIIGVVLAWIKGNQVGMWPCAVGVLLFIFVVIYKALNWKEYERDNKQNIGIILIATFILIIQMLLK
jgi:FtsH-binding integral membrane protein